MDYDSVSATEFGGSLHGIGLNILVTDVAKTAAFLRAVFAMQVHRASADFAIVQYNNNVFQLHADHTYHNNKLLHHLPEDGVRGRGLEIRVYNTDPDEAANRLSQHGTEALLLASPENKPHGLRECIILCRDGYAWVPSRPLSADEIKALA